MTHYTKDCNEFQYRQWRQIIGILSKRDGRFVAIRRGSKRPTTKGWNRTENTLAAHEALARLNAGDNIGLAAGTGDLYIFDFDRDADRGHESPRLAGTLHTYRPNATGKAKFIFRCRDPLPTRPRSRQHGIDLLGLNSNGTHAQGVIAGIHDSGAPILWGGHTVVELDRETVAALWEDWTGESLFGAEKAERSDDFYTGGDEDLERVADALRHIDPWGIDYQVWQGVIAALHDAFGDPALPLAVAWADGKPGEVEAKWRSYDRPYNGRPATLASVFHLARANGWTDTKLQDRLAAYRQWLASPAAIDALKEAGFKNPERARKLLDAIHERCEREGRQRVRPGYAWLSKQSGISKSGLGAYLARLYAAGLIEIHTGDEGQPTAIELVCHNLNAYTTDVGIGVQVASNWDAYREYRSDELFFNGHHVYAATHPRADLPPLGDNALALVAALLDGPLTIAAAAAETGHSYRAMARSFRRLVEHGLVDEHVGARNRKTYSLKAEWREILQANRPRTTTYGVSLLRWDRSLASRIKYLERVGERKRAAALQVERDRLAPIIKKVRDEAGLLPYSRQGAGHEQERRRRLTRAYLAGERALYRPKMAPSTEAARWRRRYYSAVRPLAERDWREFSAWAYVRYGPGWWTRLDITDVLGQYKLFEIDQDYVPPIRWVGDELAAAAD